MNAEERQIAEIKRVKEALKKTSSPYLKRDYEKYGKGVGTAIAYGWYVWEKGFKGEPIIRWI